MREDNDPNILLTEGKIEEGIDNIGNNCIIDDI